MDDGDGAHQDGPTGLGGWLVLVGLRVVITPFSLAVGIFQGFAPLSKEGTWEALSTEAGHHPLTQPLVAGELVANTLMLVASAYLVYLFFSKQPRFPKLFVAILVFELLFMALDGWLVSVAAHAEAIDEQSLKSIAGTLVACIVYIPYILVSKRVANTFVQDPRVSADGTS